MPRQARVAPGGLMYHVINRGVGRQPLFLDDGDYLDFERVVTETLTKCSMRILAYCLMPTHWHFILWPEKDGDLAAFMQRLTITHVTRWQKDHDRIGYGHVYQGRFKSFLIDTGEYFYQAVRYVERNALRAGLVAKAEQWQWSSLWIREFGRREHQQMLSPWPLPRSRKWVAYVNRAETKEELQALRRSCNRGAPYGRPVWVKEMCEKFGLESTIRKPGRPRKGGFNSEAQHRGR